jgi:hypothetical protein
MIAALSRRWVCWWRSSNSETRIKVGTEFEEGLQESAKARNRNMKRVQTPAGKVEELEKQGVDGRKQHTYFDSISLPSRSGSTVVADFCADPPSGNFGECFSCCSLILAVSDVG